jgi:hypothetical protein
MGTELSTLEKKFQRVVTVCKDFGINVSFDDFMVMKVSHKQGQTLTF